MEEESHDLRSRLNFPTDAKATTQSRLKDGIPRREHRGNESFTAERLCRKELPCHFRPIFTIMPIVWRTGQFRAHGYAAAPSANSGFTYPLRELCVDHAARESQSQPP